ncbi:sigma-70 family RNA polymerase sigma factor [Cellulomonas sp. Y8]|uniref:RNA polymerase sigma factor n=1 Tax=Cellulomonas sp. Y8 TaxID=2591145 RepID=UPI0011C84035
MHSAQQPAAGPDAAAGTDAAEGSVDVAGTDAPAPSPDAATGPRDAPWFEDLFARHATAVHRYLLRRGAADDAEDLAADVLTVAWRRRAEVPDGHELPWLYRTAGFVLANHRRKGRPVPVETVPDEPDPDDPAVLAVRDERVREALARLSARDRQVLLLTAWEGLTGDDLALVLGVSRGGADAALSRARSRLREAWAAD